MFVSSSRPAKPMIDEDGNDEVRETHAGENKSRQRPE
jgi:hypothetical protein